VEEVEMFFSKGVWGVHSLAIPQVISIFGSDIQQCLYLLYICAQSVQVEGERPLPLGSSSSISIRKHKKIRGELRGSESFQSRKMDTQLLTVVMADSQASELFHRPLRRSHAMLVVA
jgi:hypothetical protein